MNVTVVNLQRLLRVSNSQSWRHKSGGPRVRYMEVGELVASTVRKHCENKDGVLIINDPSETHLTWSFKKAGFKDIINTCRIPDGLREIEKDKVNRENTYIFTRKNLTTHDSEVENFICQRLPHKSWTDKPVASVFSVLGSPYLNNSLPPFFIRKLGLVSGLYAAGRVEWFQFLQPVAARRLLCGDGNYPAIFYFASGAIMNALYDVTLCATLSSSDFDPEYITQQYQKEVEVDGILITKDTVPLVKLVPKKDLFNIIPHEEIWPFYLFLKQIFRKRRERIIPLMEKFVHGCGLRMIDIGFTMMCQVGDIKPQQFLDLYLNMLRWPEYEGSILQTHLREQATNVDMKDVDIDIAEDQAVGDAHEEDEAEYIG